MGAVALGGAAISAQQTRDAPRPIGTGTANVSGTVIDDSTKRPLGRVRVTLLRTDGGSRVTLTTLDGKFEFPQLPPGTYDLSATLDAYIPSHLGSMRPGRPGRPLVVADRQQIKDLRLPIARGGVVAGTITTSFGQPATGTTVWALRRGYGASGRTLVRENSAAVDDRGQYRIFGLAPADYLILAETKQDNLSPRSGAGDEVQPGVNEGFAPSFYPGTPYESQATVIAVGPAEERLGVDVILPLLPLARASGSVVGPPGPALDVGNVELYREDETRIADSQTPRASVSDGRFSFSGLPPGSYLATAISTTSPPGAGLSPGSMLWGVTRFAVTSGDVKDLVITLRPGVNVKGRVAFTGRGRAGAPAEYRIGLIPMTNATGLGNGQFIDGQVNADSRFTIPDVPVGATFQLTWTRGFIGPWTIQSITYQGRDALAAPFEVGNEDMNDLEIVFTDTPTQVSGIARDSTGLPASPGRVIAFPADRRGWTPGSFRIKTASCGVDGRYTMSALPPGDYLFAAVDDIDEYQWYDPGWLGRLVAGAERVTLKAAEKRTLDLRVASGR